MIDTIDTLIEIGILHNNMRVSDIGCGGGNWALDFIERKLDIDYIGLDCQPICRKEFEQRIKSNRYTFHLVDINSIIYNPTGLLSAKHVEFPIETASQDLVICHSLFTHLGRYINALRYIKEIKRILKPNGFLWITFFSSPPNETNYGTQRSVYTVSEIETLIHGFTKLYCSGGETSEYHDQKMYALRYD